jgi:phosphopantetheine--protein transferase-like protein
MVRGIGNDIIEIDRVKDKLRNQRFLEKYFTKNEIELYHVRKNNAEVIAGNFAIKESVSKVFGTGVRGFLLTDIEVLRDELGKPYVILHNSAKDIAKSLGIDHLLVSISHSKKYVVGFAVGECSDNK